MRMTLNTLDLKELAKVSPGVVESYVDSYRHLNALDSLTVALDQPQDLIQRSLLRQLMKIYGGEIPALHNQIQRIASMSRQFAEIYGDGPVILLRAPARINILGEHVDYVSYLPTESLPFGSREHDMLMLVRRSDQDRVRGASTAKEYSSFSFELSDGPNGAGNVEVDSAWLSYLFEHPASAPHWSNYVKGPAYFSRIQLGDKLKRGFDFVVDSGIPAGGGASSSSALVVLANAALRIVNGIPYASLELARDSSKAEWYVGTRGGAMDHITICLAKPDHAVLISFANQQAQQINLPGQEYRWVTFFSEPADKGRAVMIEYNERAAISRIVIPALIDGWKTKCPALYERWQLALESFDSLDALEEVGELIDQLPESLSLVEIQKDYPEAFASCAQSFPALVAERAERPLQVRLRAIHHLGEIRRVKTATKVLTDETQDFRKPSSEKQNTADSMRALGTLLNQSHASLRDYYEVSTAEVERLIEIIRMTPEVCGARLMGGGFGGNVLVLTTAEVVEPLEERVQIEYYEPRGRNGVEEGSVLVSTPGDGLAQIEVEEVWREVITDFNLLQHESKDCRASINHLLDLAAVEDSDLPVWPIIVAAGKGTRSLASGLTTAKPVAPVLGIPAIQHVIENIRAAFGSTRPPIVVVSPETECAIRECVKEEAIFVVQQNALGTGDAVLCAQSKLENFTGRALVIWGTQPMVQAATMRRTLTLASLFSAYDMVLPTVYKDLPYAPISRNANGMVESARETHLERTEQLPFGESNIGMFLLQSKRMFEALTELKQRYWNEADRSYNRAGGELGFPNELINYFAARNSVFACPIADSREEQGIKTRADIERCEQFIAELAS